MYTRAHTHTHCAVPPECLNNILLYGHIFYRADERPRLIIVANNVYGYRVRIIIVIYFGRFGIYSATSDGLVRGGDGIFFPGSYYLFPIHDYASTIGKTSSADRPSKYKI